MARVGSLRGGKTDELDAKSGSDDDDAGALESVSKRSAVVPILSADVLAMHSVRGTATAVEVDGDEYEPDDTDEEFEIRGPKFLLCVSKCPDNADRDYRELQCHRSEIDSQGDLKNEKRT